MNELEIQKNKIIEELYKTGRYQGFYMGIFSKSKQNPIKAYIKQWLVCKGIRANLSEMIEDFYAELFIHITKIKPEKLIELAENNKKLTATICLICQRQLMQQRSEGKMYIKISHFEYTNWHSAITNKDASELEVIADVKENTVEEFKKRFGVDVDQIVNAMSEKEKEEFYTVALRKGRVKKADLPEWTKLQMRVYETVRRLREQNQL